MAIRYKDMHQQEETEKLLTYVFENGEQALRTNDFDTIYELVNSYPEQQDADVLGKFTEELLEIEPRLLYHMTKIPAAMFCGSTIEQLLIPANITEIGRWAFMLSSIKHIIYEGTKENWKNMLKQSDPTAKSLDRNKRLYDIIVDCADVADIYANSPINV